MSTLYAGFARVNVTPIFGTSMIGCIYDRYSDGVLDNLEINALALACGEEKVLLLSMDTAEVYNDCAEEFRARITKATGIPSDAILIHATHTHTGPYMRKDGRDELEREYYRMVCYKMADVAKFAMEDLKPAKMGWGVGNAPGISFIRRYRMKDGSVKTNPGIGNPDILEPIGAVDDRVNVLRFDREGGDTLVLANFGCHPDTVGGNSFSGDWPAATRRTLEKAIPGTKCIFFNGAQGDVNHVNVRPVGGDLNNMEMGFDGVARGYNHAEYMGRVVTAGILQCFDKVKYEEVDSLRYKEKVVKLPSNMPKPEDMERAYEINAIHQAGRDEELPYEGMMLTTIVAEAERMIRLEHGPEFYDMNLSCVAIGNVVILGIPGEPFNGVGVGLKKAEGWEVVLPFCLTNGAKGYFPMMDSYEEGGYEARSSNFKAGVAELIIEEGTRLMGEIR